MARAVGRPRARASLYRERGPGERWWFGLLLIPALLTTVVVYTQGEAIESDLAQDAVDRVRSAGLARTTVQMSGRNATLLVPTGENENAALKAVGQVEGIGDIRVENVAANAREARACDELQTKVDRALGGRGIAFAGASTRLTGAGLSAVRAVGKVLAACPSADVVAEGHTDPSVLNGGKVSLSRAEAVRRALARSGVPMARIDVKGFGSTYPVTAGGSNADRARNNRVAVTVAGD